MEENKNIEQTQNIQQDNGDSSQDKRTFTQDEVNDIVQRRLAKDRKSREVDAQNEVEKSLREREKALQDKENEMYAKELFADNKMPDDLLEIVKGRDKAEIDNILKILKPYIDKANEPINNPVAPTNGKIASTDSIRKAMGLDR